MSTYTVRWDLTELPEDVAFPYGFDQWPVWLTEAIYAFADGRPLRQPDRVELIEMGRTPAYLALVAHEPYLKKATHRVILKPALDPGGARSLIVVRVAT